DPTRCGLVVSVEPNLVRRRRRTWTRKIPSDAVLFRLRDSHFGPRFCNYRHGCLGGDRGWEQRGDHSPPGATDGCGASLEPVVEGAVLATTGRVELLLRFRVRAAAVGRVHHAPIGGILVGAHAELSIRVVVRQIV